MVVEVAATAAALAAVMRVAEGAALMPAPTALATMAGISKGRQQSTKEQQKWWLRWW